MHVQSVLSLSKLADKEDAFGDLAIAHVTKDRGRPEFRRHVWLLVTYLIDFYLVFLPWQQIARDLESLAGALSDTAKEMEAAHGAPAPKPA